MNNVTAIVLLSIFIPIGVVLGCAGLYVILKVFFLKKYSSYYDEYEKFIEREPYIEILTVLKVVDIILVQQEKLAVERMTTSATGFAFSVSRRARISPVVPWKVLTSIPVFASKSAASLFASPAGDGMYTVTIPLSEADRERTDRSMIRTIRVFFISSFLSVINP